MFALLYREHKELLKEMMQPGRYSDDIEHELEQLAKKIESKGDQISKLKKHQDSVRTLYLNKRCSSENYPSSEHKNNCHTMLEKIKKNC